MTQKQISKRTGILMRVEDLVKSEVEKAIKEERQLIVMKITDYFNGLIFIPDPQKTRDSIVSLITDKGNSN